MLPTDSENLDYIAALEREIEKKYGEDAARSVRDDWDEEKEKKYLRQLKREAEKEQSYYRQREAKRGKKTLITKQGEPCEVCGRIGFDSPDGVYRKLWGCCRICYYQHVVGEEDRWEKKKKRLINERSAS